MEYTSEMRDLVNEIARLKARKQRPGTKIYYAEKRLARLLAAGPVKSERKTLSQKRSPRKKSPTLYSTASTQNRAYVLSHEIYDLTQAMIALERLR